MKVGLWLVIGARGAKLFAVVLAVHAARPAARPTHSFNEFFVGACYSLFASFYKFCTFHPANPFIASKWCDVIPEGKSRGMGE